MLEFHLVLVVYQRLAIVPLIRLNGHCNKHFFLVVVFRRYYFGIIIVEVKVFIKRTNWIDFTTWHWITVVEVKDFIKRTNWFHFPSWYWIIVV